MNFFKRAVYTLFEKITEQIPLLSSQPTQRFIGTTKHRYPDIFSEVSRFINREHITQPGILSFGCSHGEELITLRHLFPTADITGIDINPLIIILAKWRTRKAGVSLLRSLDILIEKGVQFDVVFAMAVLQRTDDWGEEKKIFRFEHFEYWVSRLHKTVKPGGLLVIENVDFDFAETSLSKYYLPLEWEGNLYMHSRPVYDRKSLKNPPRAINRIYRRIA